jgi:hypothetical protein
MLPDVSCAWCTKAFRPDKAGRLFCCQACSIAKRSADAKAAKEHAHCSVEGCARPVKTRGMCSGHYQTWNRLNAATGFHRKYSGTCEHCKAAFFSAKPKKFCSMNCYIASDHMRDLMREKREKSWAKMGVVPGLRIEVQCLNCGEKREFFPSFAKNGGNPHRNTPRRFCNRMCYRLFMAKRFDRWFATPETIALPQGYDEFLTKNELPCLVDGCTWVGKNLSTHMNYTHGVPAHEFKRLAGFNHKTGVVSATCRAKLGRKGSGKPELFKLAKKAPIGAPRMQLRNEGREHLHKSRLLFKESGVPRVYAPRTKTERVCQSCGFRWLSSSNKTVSLCRPCVGKARIERQRDDAPSRPLVCDVCTRVFLVSRIRAANTKQKKRLNPQSLTTCSAECRRTLKARNVPLRGPCLQCGKMFRTYHEAKYCSRECYRPTLSKALAERNKKL